MIKIPMNLSLSTDDDGFLTFQCPSCSDRFGLNGEEFKEKDCPHLFCPSCGLEHDSGKFLKTRDDVRKQIEIASINALTKELERSFKGNKQISVKAGKPLEVEPGNLLPETGELEIADVTCCESTVKVDPLAKQIGIYCPFCGLNQMNTDQEIRNLRKKLWRNWNLVKEYSERNVSTNPLNYLDILINIINRHPLLRDYLEGQKYDFQDKIQNNWVRGGLKETFDSLARSGEEKEILVFLYQFLKEITNEFNQEYGQYSCNYEKVSWIILVEPSSNFVGKSSDKIREFNNIIETHFISHINYYLESLMNNHEQKTEPNVNRTIHTEHYYEQSHVGIGNMNGGEIKEGAKVAGVINEAAQQNLAQAADEIQQLLEQLSKTYPTNTTADQMIVAAKAIEQIESDPTWKQRVINAAKEGGLSAFEKALDNPIGALITGAIKGWLEAKAE